MKKITSLLLWKLSDSKRGVLLGCCGLWHWLQPVVLKDVGLNVRIKQIVCRTQTVYFVPMFLISVANTLWVFLVAAILMGIGFGGAQPVLQAASLRDVELERRGAASATYTIGQSSGFAICYRTYGLRIPCSTTWLWWYVCSDVGICFLRNTRYVYKRAIYEKSFCGVNSSSG